LLTSNALLLLLLNVLQVLSGGAGPLSQLSYLSGLPEAPLGLFLAGLAAFNLAAGLAPNSATFKPETVAANEADAADGPLRNPKVMLFQVKKFFGVTDWGFTAQNELFAGRLAQLGFAAALIGEAATGLGPLGQAAAGGFWWITFPSLCLAGMQYLLKA
jgi:photosystem II protein